MKRERFGIFLWESWKDDSEKYLLKMGEEGCIWIDFESDGYENIIECYASVQDEEYVILFL